MNDGASFLHQACFYPIESLEKLNEFLEQIKPHFVWNQLGFLTDEGYKNQVFLLMSNDFNASLRLNLPEIECQQAVEQYMINEKMQRSIMRAEPD